MIIAETKILFHVSISLFLFLLIKAIKYQQKAAIAVKITGDIPNKIILRYKVDIPRLPLGKKQSREKASY